MRYKAITISGKIAVGTSTLASNLKESLSWKYINAGAIQREYDRKNNINENKQGALSRSDEHEREIDNLTQELLRNEENIIYEGWLAGYMAQNINGILKVLVTCSQYNVRVDRVVNRDGVTVDEAKHWIKTREAENIKKWHRLYGEKDFWDRKYYDLIVDTYTMGPLETAGRVLDKLGYKG